MGLAVRCRHGKLGGPGRGETSGLPQLTDGGTCMNRPHGLDFQPHRMRSKPDGLRLAQCCRQPEAAEGGGEGGQGRLGAWAAARVDTGSVARRVAMHVSVVVDGSRELQRCARRGQRIDSLSTQRRGSARLRSHTLETRFSFPFLFVFVGA